MDMQAQTDARLARVETRVASVETLLGGAVTRVAAVETGRAVAAAVRVNMARVGVAARGSLTARPVE